MDFREAGWSSELNYHEKHDHLRFADGEFAFLNEYANGRRPWELGILGSLGQDPTYWAAVLRLQIAPIGRLDLPHPWYMREAVFERLALSHLARNLRRVLDYYPPLPRIGVVFKATRILVNKHCY